MDRRQPYDVLVLGAGLAGGSLASGLARAGHSVALVVGPGPRSDELRAEKFGQASMQALERLGLGPAARAATTSYQRSAVGRFGLPAGCVHEVEYAMRYPDFIRGLQAALPRGVSRIDGLAREITSIGDVQRVVLGDGQELDARLVVLATGLGRSLHRQLGFAPEVLSRAHTMVHGFDLASISCEHSHAPSARQALTWHGENFGDGVAYLTVFPLRESFRANLFTHWRSDDDVARTFVVDPSAALRMVLPRLCRLLGPFEPIGPVQRRVSDLVWTRRPVRDGVVMIGDAFATTCPSTGTGIHRALVDAETLLRELPTWLASPGMAASKLATFYSDRAKVGTDSRALSASFSGRRLRMEAGRTLSLRRAAIKTYHRGRCFAQLIGGCPDTRRL